MQARPVKPAKGSVCVFPHGASAGSLLHEVCLFTLALARTDLCDRVLA